MELIWLLAFSLLVVAGMWVATEVDRRRVIARGEEMRRRVLRLAEARADLASEVIALRTENDRLRMRNIALRGEIIDARSTDPPTLTPQH